MQLFLNLKKGKIGSEADFFLLLHMNQIYNIIY
jgi:hypothetical protein